MFNVRQSENYFFIIALSILSGSGLSVQTSHEWTHKPNKAKETRRTLKVIQLKKLLKS